MSVRRARHARSMDFDEDNAEVLSTVSLLLVFLLNTNYSLMLSSFTKDGDDNSLPLECRSWNWEMIASEVDAASRTTLNHFRLYSTLAMVDEDLGYWVKPRSTTWFTRFLLEEYDDARWIQMFRMSKQSVLNLSHLLSPTVKKKDTRYRRAVPVLVRITCTLFKLCHGANLLICSELFAVGRSTVARMLRQVVHAINIHLRGEMMWPRGHNVVDIAQDFEDLCGLPGVAGAIDGTHFPISKPRAGAADYFYFKSGGYSMHCQAVVDSSKRFIDMYVGMPGSTNDSRVLRRSTLYYRGQRSTLWDGVPSFRSFSPYLIGDAGFPLLPWLLVPHRRNAPLAIADQLFNRKLSKGRAVVENAFALLKRSFRELHQKSELDISFLPDVVICCGLLHNVLLQQSHADVERLLEVLHSEGRDQHLSAEQVIYEDAEGLQGPLAEQEEGLRKRRDLGVFLSLQTAVGH